MFFRLLDDVEAAVRADGLPRVVRSLDQDGVAVPQVAYLDEAAFRTMLASEWPGALPTDPTPAQSEAAITARETERGNRHAAGLLKKQGVLALAQSAVGVKVGVLNPRQVEALLGVLLLKIGGLDDDLKVLPLEEWAG